MTFYYDYYTNHSLLYNKSIDKMLDEELIWRATNTCMQLLCSKTYLGLLEFVILDNRVFPENWTLTL